MNQKHVGGLTGNEYSWTPSTALPSGIYVLEIEGSTSPNYSVPFQLTGPSLSLTTMSQPSPSATSSKETKSSSTEKPTSSASSAVSTAIAPTSTISSGSIPSLSTTSQTPSASPLSTSSGKALHKYSEEDDSLWWVVYLLSSGGECYRVVEWDSDYGFARGEELWQKYVVAKGQVL
jgi:hypothetical protein